MASEDIGNADPRGLQLALDAWQTYERLGSPEGELAIAQAIVYLASTAKSNAVYVAYKAAMLDAANSASLDVPEHLRNPPTQFMKKLGYGRDYRYAHDEEGAFAAGESYFPETLGEKQYDAQVVVGWIKATMAERTRAIGSSASRPITRRNNDWLAVNSLPGRASLTR